MTDHRRRAFIRRERALVSSLTAYTMAPKIHEPAPKRDYSQGSSFIPGLTVITDREILVHGSREIRRFIYQPFDDDPGWEELDLWAKTHALFGDSENMAKFNRGVRLPDRSVPDDALLERIKARLLGEYDALTAPVFDPASAEAARRAYIPGLMEHGRMPAFIGPKGWGKTLFLCPLAAALVIPDVRFLSAFDPAEMTDEERQRDAWLINPESPPGDVHEMLLRSGLRYGRRRRGAPVYFSDELGPESGALVVEHLDATTGGPSSFDLTQPERVQWWATRLIEYGDREMPPLTLIADDITAVVRNDTGRYGAFTSGLADLRREVGIPNGLGVLHSPMDARTLTPMGGVESMGQWDGMWFADATRFPIFAETPRHFRSVARTLGVESPRRRVHLDRATGTMRLGDEEVRPAVEQEHEGTDSRREYLTARLGELGERGGWTKEVCRPGEDYQSDKAELERMVDDKVATVERQQLGKMRGVRWKLAAD